MLKIKHQFAGITPRPNVFSKLKKFIVYASKSNVYITTLDKMTCVILRHPTNLITYLYTFENKIAISDTAGNVEVYMVKSNHNEITYDLTNTFSFGCLINSFYICLNNMCVAITMEAIMVGNNNVILNQTHKDSIPSCVTGIEYNRKQLILVSYEDGNLEVYEYYEEKLNLLFKINAHQNGIKSAKVNLQTNRAFLVTASLDTTLKVWEFIYDEDIISLNCLNILSGHNDWVYSCEWDGMQIISSSSDNSIIIWKHDGENSWSLENRLGGVLEKNKTFYGAFVMDGHIFAHSITGGIYVYEKESYQLKKICSGHTDEITSIDTKDDFVITTSADHTTRIFSLELGEEIARPQIHGYSVQSAKFLRKPGIEIVSGADETIMRIYNPTRLFYENCFNILKKLLPNEKYEKIETNMKYCEDELHYYAKQSELSLTNEICNEHYSDILAEGNTERNLSTNFLFVEKLKVYGHFFEICEIAVCDRFIASANKSKNYEFSGVFIWDYTFSKVDYIKHHDLNIVKMAFSTNGEYLIAASRDTKVSLYRYVNGKFSLQQLFTKHNRIVNDCCFSRDNNYAFSVSKDKKIVKYDLDTMKVNIILTFEDEVLSIIALDDCKIAIGLNTGYLNIYDHNNDKLELVYCVRLHSGSVKCLNYSKNNMLISGGSDGLVNILEIKHTEF